MPNRSIKIAVPCHENWESLNPISGGRHCESCCKTVVDFSMMSNREIIAYLSVHSNVCGRVSQQQLDHVSQYHQHKIKSESRFRSYRIIVLLAALLTISKAEANNSAESVAKAEQLVSPSKKDTLDRNTPKFIKITGTVHDNDSVLPGATIAVKGTNIKTVTNALGKFQLNVPADAKFIEIQFVGYETKTIKIKNLKKQKYNIELTLNTMVLGEIAVVSYD